MADQVSTSDQAPLTDGLGIGLTARAAISLHRGECCGQVTVSELIIVVRPAPGAPVPPGSGAESPGPRVVHGDGHPGG